MNLDWSVNINTGNWHFYATDLKENFDSRISMLNLRTGSSTTKTKTMFTDYAAYQVGQ